MPVILTMNDDSIHFEALRAAAVRAGAIDLIPAFRFVGSDFLEYQADLARKAALVLNALSLLHDERQLLIAAAAALRSVLRHETLF